MEDIAQKDNVVLDAEEREYWAVEAKKFWQHMAESGRLKKALERGKIKDSQSQ